MSQADTSELDSKIIGIIKSATMFAFSRGNWQKPIELHELIDYTTAVRTLLDTEIAKAREETEKAYGGCHNCYGKGYATTIEYASGWDTDQDIGSTGGRVFFPQDPIRFCNCSRGKQLKKLLKGEDK